MEFEKSFFEDEVIEGFYVPALMKKSWAATLKVLYEVDKLCRRHGIKYYVCWGTLIGAVRHGGFVPWDDDVDICIIGEEYNRFMDVIDELPDGFYYKDYHCNETTDNMVSTISNYESVVVDDKTLKEFYGYPYVAAIDVFRFDYLPPDPGEEAAYRELYHTIGEIVSAINSRLEGKDFISEQQIEEAVVQLENFAKIKIDRDKSIKHQIYDFMTDTLASIYNEREAKEVTMLPKWSYNKNFRIPKDCYEDVVSIPFMGMDVYAPVGYERFFDMTYGKSGYMNPIRKGGSHEYPAYDNIQEKISEVGGPERIVYQYSKEQIDEINSKKEKRDDLYTRIMDFIPLFSEAHGEIVNSINNNDVEMLVDVLTECQNCAVELGNIIEQEKGEGTNSVAELEKYCECLFNITQLEIINVDAVEMLNAVIDEFTNIAERELKRKKEIVFVPYKPQLWGTFDQLYKDAKKEDANVYVIPAPYYYKDHYGEEDEKVYITEGYPDYVEITLYENYNFKAHHPDEIYIQNPFDDTNCSMGMHPFFYSTSLKLYTDKLIYVPALIMDEVEPDDERMKINLKSYINTPGVVHADKVYVQSKQMKNVYIEMLIEFAGKDTEHIWKEKIEHRDFLKEAKQIEKRMDIPDEWKARIEGKKVLLMYTSASAIVNEKEKTLEKIRYAIELVDAKTDIVLWWRPDKNIRNILRKNYPGLWLKYQDIVKNFKENDRFIFDDTLEVERAINFCDVAYGNGGTTLYRCRLLGKPVMIMN